MTLSMPLTARSEGMSLANGDTDRVITQGAGGLKRVIFKTIAWDTDPGKNPGTMAPGLCILKAGTNDPDGRYRTTQTGYYAFNVGIGLDVAASSEISLYTFLRDRGADDTGNSVIHASNIPCRGGTHPTVNFRRIVRVSTEIRWFDVACYYLASDGTNPTTLKLGDYDYQSFCEINFLGPLT